MSDEKIYDAAIIGGGIGGYTCAIKCAQLGLKTVLFEKQSSLGGTCLNVGCIPSKALLSATELLLQIGDTAESMGILCEKPRFDLTRMMKHKDDVVTKLTAGVKELLKQNGVQVEYGTARTKGPETVVVDDRNSGTKEFRTKALILATGSIVKEIPGLPFNGENIIDSTDALSLKKVPDSLMIAGAGPIGLEMASIWNRLGAKVIVVEMMDGILPGWDKQIVRGLQRELEKQGITFILNAKISDVETVKSGLTIEIEKKDGTKEEQSTELLLVAAGRQPFCDDAIKTDLKLKADSAGRIEVDKQFQTSSPGVYAIGDLIHGPMLAHKAEEEGFALAEMLAGKPLILDPDSIPGVVYTSPEAAAVGKSEEELKTEGTEYNKGVFQFRANGKALASGHSAGFVKILSDKRTDRLLGAHIFGEQAGILIQEAVSVLAFRGSAEDIARTIHSHPTLSEAVKEAALAAYDKPIHSV